MTKNKGLNASLLAILAMESMAYSTSGRGGNDGSFGHGIPNNKPKVIPNGCKEYTYFGFTVVSISEKSARKKCSKLAGRVKW